MTRKYPHLSSPITLGRVTFRNRMFAAPTGATDITWDCCAGPGSRAFYENRAKGGSANVTVSELVVHPATDASHMLHLELQTPGSLASFTMMADAIRRHGAIPSVELSHSGQYAGTYLVDKEKKASLSQYGPCDGVRPDGRPVKALAKEQIADIVASYGEKAALAKRAGFEMVMIHAGHGWLINQFLSPYFNKRDDEYGGSLEGRARLLLEVVASVRAAVGPGFPIEVRMSGSNSSRAATRWKTAWKSPNCSTARSISFTCRRAPISSASSTRIRPCSPNTAATCISPPKSRNTCPRPWPPSAR